MGPKKQDLHSRRDTWWKHILSLFMNIIEIRKEAEIQNDDIQKQHKKQKKEKEKLHSRHSVLVRQFKRRERRKKVEKERRKEREGQRERERVKERKSWKKGEKKNQTGEKNAIKLPHWVLVQYPLMGILYCKQTSSDHQVTIEPTFPWAIKISILFYNPIPSNITYPCSFDAGETTEGRQQRWKVKGRHGPANEPGDGSIFVDKSLQMGSLHFGCICH